MSNRPLSPPVIVDAALSAPSLDAAAPARSTPPVSTRASQPGYSIRLAESPGTPCALCIEPTGAGPVGYLDEDPICDRCLLENCAELGMVLALVCVSREYGAFTPASEEEHYAALSELGAFARVYETFALRSGPRRRILRPAGSDDGPAN